MPELSDQSWEQIGQVDAYYGVLTYEQYTRHNLDQVNRDQFFKSGQDHLNWVLGVIKDQLNSEFSIHRALDFGCGVGRILIPLALESVEAVGMDVAPSMLSEAKMNCSERGVDNVQLVQSDDMLSELSGRFNFIHSFIVFQHIPVKRGMKIFDNLVERLEENGIGVIHFTYHRNISMFRRIFQRLRQNISLINGLANVLFQQRAWNYPALQMHEYNLSEIFWLLQRHSCQKIHVVFSEHSSPFTTSYGVVLFFIKGTRQ